MQDFYRPDALPVIPPLEEDITNVYIIHTTLSAERLTIYTVNCFIVLTLLNCSLVSFKVLRSLYGKIKQTIGK